MRQNRDGSEASSAGACASASAQFLATARPPVSPPRDFECRALPGSGSLALSDSVSTGVSFPPPLPVCTPLCLPASVSLASSVCLSVCLSASPWSQANFPILLASTGLTDHKGGGGPRALRPRPSRPAAPPPSPPAPPARSHLVSPARAAAAAASYARQGRGWSFKRRFPGAQLGPVRSLMALVAANHEPLPPPARPAGAVEPLWA